MQFGSSQTGPASPRSRVKEYGLSLKAGGVIAEPEAE